MIHVDDVEWLWIVVNMTALIGSLYALREALQDRRAVRALNGPAREIAADGAVIGEGFRVTVIALLLGTVAPSLFSDRDLSLVIPTPPYVSGVTLLVTAAVVILVWTAFDLRERRRLMAIIARETAA